MLKLCILVLPVVIPSGSFRQESGVRLYVLFQSFLSLYEMDRIIITY
uniref:Uncharacterized protein n=1 Tax=Candidatus Nitrotoga fabula TaxID=2182327 RepID=A0A2X0R8Q1_9PROT|nr:protein of unknown function [Candidatus Nitrotoga fabula]